VLPPSDPRLWTIADVLALSDERQAARQRADDAWRHGCAYGQWLAGRPRFDSIVRDAYLMGTRDAYARRQGAFEAGYQAALDRFADLVGGRAELAHPTPLEIQRWTRHSPRCGHGGHGGKVYCKRAGCIPGARSDYGLPAPWDRSPGPENTARIRRSWGLPVDDAEYADHVSAARRKLSAQLRGLRQPERSVA
jgi:hypothetical protein